MQNVYLSIQTNYFIFLHVLCFSDDEDDTAELLAELQRIKKERAQEEARKVRFLLYTSISTPGPILLE